MIPLLFLITNTNVRLYSIIQTLFYILNSFYIIDDELL